MPGNGGVGATTRPLPQQEAGRLRSSATEEGPLYGGWAWGGEGHSRVVDYKGLQQGLLQVQEEA